MDDRSLYNTEWILTHGFYANQGGFVLKFSESDQATARSQKTLNADQIRYLVQAGYITSPTIPEEEIKDKSKPDFLANGVAIWQVAWLLIEICDRQAKKMPSSPLDISALSFSACIILTYAMWFEKPLAVKSPTTIHIGRFPPAALAELRSLSTKSIMAYFFLIDNLGRGTSKPFHSRIFNDSYFIDRYQLICFPRDVFVMVDWEFGVAVVSKIFGSLHLTAWNFEFPTAVEKMVWRAARVYSASIMPSVFAVGTLVTFSALKIAPHGTYKHKDLIFSVPIVALSILYSLCRFYLLGESFASLRALPP